MSNSPRAQLGPNVLHRSNKNLPKKESAEEGIKVLQELVKVQRSMSLVMPKQDQEICRWMGSGTMKTPNRHGTSTPLNDAVSPDGRVVPFQSL